MIIIYVTFPDLRIAKKICKILIKEKLIACANILRSRSLFEWNKKLNEVDEFVAIMKTEEKNRNKIEKIVKKLHPYEIPAILYFKVRSSKEFENWVKSTIK